MTYRTGQLVELHTPPHPYIDEQLGWTDTSYIVPAKTERYTIKRVGQRGDDVRLTLRDETGRGCGILVNRWLSHRGWGRTLKIVA